MAILFFNLDLLKLRIYLVEQKEKKIDCTVMTNKLIFVTRQVRFFT